MSGLVDRQIVNATRISGGSILVDSKADILIYGMGEQPIKAVVNQLKDGKAISDLKDIPQIAYLIDKDNLEAGDNDISLFSHEECLADKMKQAKNFKVVEEQSNLMNASRILQSYGKDVVVINPPYPPMDEEEIDASFDLSYTRLPHPKYKGKKIPAFDMIRFSVNMHRYQIFRRA